MSHDILYRDMSPETGFSPKMCTPRNFYRNICVGSRCISNDSGKLKLKEDYHHLYLHKYVFKYVGIILGKKLSSVPKVWLINILYQNVCYCQGKAVKPCQCVWVCQLNDQNMHGVPSTKHSLYYNDTDNVLPGLDSCVTNERRCDVRWSTSLVRISSAFLPVTDAFLTTSAILVVNQSTMLNSTLLFLLLGHHIRKPW